MGNAQRLNKYLANLGICSRRNVESFLSDNTVTVNGEIVTQPGVRIDPQKDTILLNGKTIKKPTFVYYLLNKPKGVVSTTADEYGRKNVISLIPTTERIYPVGRLDKDTTGLLILTNDGELTNQLIHPKYHVDKVYKLTIRGQTNDVQLKALRNGVLLEDGITSPAKVVVSKVNGAVSQIEMTIHEGRNRQIRRMCQTVGIELLELQRISFGPITLGNLKIGRYRNLNPQEVQLLKNLR
ncbi:MAG TPA: pseudouridine synthase [Candidatus Saccharimonadales bacterium]|nr:pseudouridine synthase [Candidatus Saccharimonadales bacterium]